MCKASAAKAYGLLLIPRIHMVGGQNELTNVALGPPHLWYAVCTPTHIHRKYNLEFSKNSFKKAGNGLFIQLYQMEGTQDGRDRFSTM